MTKPKQMPDSDADAEGGLVEAQEAERKAALRKKQSHSAMNSRSNSTLVVEAYGKKVWGELDLQTIYNELSDKCRVVFSGDTHPSESLLFSQAKALDAMFAALSCRALSQDYLEQFDTNLRLALKAQNQCRMTLETLAAIKNPPVVFAKQANIAHGNQQVNNEGTVASAPVRARVRQIESKPNELLGHDHGKRVDTGATGKAGRSNKAVATVEVVNGATNRRRQSKRQP